MVLRPRSLVDFTLKSKESVVNFAQTLKILDSIKSAAAYADSVVEVRIDSSRQDFLQSQFRQIYNKITMRLLEPPYELPTDLISNQEPEFLE